MTIKAAGRDGGEDSKMKKAFPIFAALLLASCASAPRTAELPQLRGQPLSAAVGHFGSPQQTIRQHGMNDVYVWTHDVAWQSNLPEQGPSVSVVGKNVVYRPGMRGRDVQTYTWECRLVVSVDKGSIASAVYSGDAPACDYFRGKMKP